MRTIQISDNEADLILDLLDANKERLVNELRSIDKAQYAAPNRGAKKEELELTNHLLGRFK
jgi:hypothetical protein